MSASSMRGCSYWLGLIVQVVWRLTNNVELVCKFACVSFITYIHVMPVSDEFSVPLVESAAEKCVFTNCGPRLRLKVNSITQTKFHA